MAFIDTPSRHNLTSPPAAADPQIILWVSAAAAGDRYSFHQLMDHYQKGIYRMTYYRVRDRMDAEDLTQDIFLQAFENLPRLKSPGKFKSWLYRIAVNRVRDYQRKRNFRSLFGLFSINENRAHPSDAKNEANGEKEAIRKDFWRQVRHILNRLSAKEQEVFLLRFFDQFSIKEISDTLGKSDSTVKTLLYRAIKKFRVAGAHLDQWGERAAK